MTKSISFFSESSEETQEAGRKIAKLISPGDVLCLTGDLGAGKTTLMKGLSQEFAQVNPEEVTSPTFTYLHIYSGTQKIHHFDLYRLESSKEFLMLGFDEFFSDDSICCVEWPNNIPEELQFRKVSIEITYASSNKRKITFRRSI
jgi:tRNA threonylcarbamoyladenosine biosynthesis protein TsaE